MTNDEREATAKALDALGITAVYAIDPVDGSRIEVVSLDDLARIRAVIEKAHTPTDDERCSRVQHGMEPCCAGCAATAHRPVQGEPTAAQVTAALDEWHHARENLHEQGEAMFFALRAAFQVGGQ